MRNKSEGYFKEYDFISVEKFNDALIQLDSPQKKSSENHQKRKEIVTELIEKLKNNTEMSSNDKISFLNAAIIHPAFSSRKFGAIKRGINALVSGGEGPSLNLHPFFKSSSQSRLIIYRDLVQKEISSEVRKSCNK